jgi:hypothetical protein
VWPCDAVHVVDLTLLAGVAGKVALTARTDFVSNPSANATPATANAVTAIEIEISLRILSPVVRMVVACRPHDSPGAFSFGYRPVNVL